MPHPIVKNGVRILRPAEYQMLRDCVRDLHNQVFLDLLLHTGMRYEEFRRFAAHPEWYDRETATINLNSGKPEARQRERWIYLSAPGRNAIEYFQKLKREPSDRTVWDINLGRWAKKAGLPEGGCVSAKTTRKTWESWLVTAYPHVIPLIVMSLGHSEITAMGHYLNLPFTAEDKRQMMHYVAGWGPAEMGHREKE